MWNKVKEQLRSPDVYVSARGWPAVVIVLFLLTAIAVGINGVVHDLSATYGANFIR